MAATAISLHLRPNRHRLLRNPNFIHFFSSSSDDTTSPPPQSQFFNDVQASLKQSPLPQPQPRRSFSPSSTNRSSSLEEIKKNLSEFKQILNQTKKWMEMEDKETESTLSGSFNYKDLKHSLVMLGDCDKAKKMPKNVGGIEESKETQEEEKPEELSTTKMSTATRSKSSVSAQDLLANARAKYIVKTEGGKPPTPKSVVSSFKASEVMKKGTEFRKRKIEDVETLDAKYETLKIEKVKETFEILVKDFTDKGSELMSFTMGQLTAREEHVAIMKNKADMDNFRAEEAEKKARANASEVVKLKKENRVLKTQVEELKNKMEKEIDDHVKELEAASKEFEYNATKTLLKARIQMMEEYKDGLQSTWDINEERRIYEAHVGEPMDIEEVNSSPKDAVVNQGEEDVKGKQIVEARLMSKVSQ